MNSNEYLELFSSAGVYTVEVRFSNHDGTVSLQRMFADEIGKLIDPATGNFYSEMRFDDWLGEVTKYQILPKSKKVVIFAKLVKGD
ncbi:MAG: hypothetical protein H6985_18440 [Pseudomonadales bacterium]|nr:hypothetical protein [Pseudomonadales bacterium]